MIACYLRVSSHKQRTASQSPAIERWLKGHGHDPENVLWFEDKETGRTLSRAAFDRLQAAIFNGEVKTVVVWKLDRLSRKQRDGINILADWCERGIRVVSVTQELDLTGTMGRIVAGVLFGLAEIELEHGRERQAAGIEAAKRRGVYKGRQLGATKADPAKARELRAKGLSIKDICRTLGVKSEATVRAYLRT